MNNELKVENLANGDRIDSELEIQSIFDVSRITARQAILELEKEGLVERGRGKGTFVSYKPKIEEELHHIRSFTKEMESLGYQPGTSWINLTKETLDSKAANRFDVKSDQEMYCLRRVRTADDIKMMYIVSYFPLETNLKMDSLTESVYEALEQSGYGSPHTIVEKIGASLPDEEICRRLEIDGDQAILTRQRKSYDKEGGLMELTMCYYRGDMYNYVIRTEN